MDMVSPPKQKEVKDTRMKEDRSSDQLTKQKKGGGARV